MSKINVVNKSKSVSAGDVPFGTFFTGVYNGIKGVFYMSADGYVISMDQGLCAGVRREERLVSDYKVIDGPKILSTESSKSKPVVDVPNGTYFKGSVNNGRTWGTFLKTEELLLCFCEAENGCDCANAWSWDNRQYAEMDIEHYCEVDVEIRL